MSMQFGSNTDPMSDLRDETADQVRKVADRAEDLATSAKQQARRVADRAGGVTEQVGDVATNFKGASDRSLKQQPMATLAGSCDARFRARCLVEIVSVAAGPKRRLGTTALPRARVLGCSATHDHAGRPPRPAQAN
jgi:hypothetical protein